MKKTKVLLSLLLSFLMIFSSVSILAEEATTASVAFTDVATGTKTADAITKLVAHGIMNGYPDGSFKPDGSITRAEVAAVIVRFQKLADNLPADAVTGFSDLDNDSSAAWARPYVKAAVDAKIINGFEDGTYRASEPVTYEQLIKMIICAINYDVIASSEKSKLEAMGQTTTWSSGYIAAANRYGITANALMANVTMPASRGTVAIVTSNALDAPAINTHVDANGDVQYEMGDTSIGEEGRDNLKEIIGYVSGNYYTSLTSQAPGIAPSEILITSDGVEKDYELSSALLARTDVEDILGKRVTAYYSALDREITSLTVDTPTTKVIKEQDIKGISGSTLKYGRDVTMSLDGYTFIYNGKYLPSDQALALLNSQFENGQIELINDNIKVAKVTSYDVGVVKSYTSSTKYIYLRYEGLNAYYEYKPKEFDLVMVNGAETDPENVTFSSYNVINVLESPAGAAGNTLKKMYVTKKNVSGTVTETTDNNRAVILNGTTYYLTKPYHNFAGTSSEQKAPFDIDGHYNCYLDYTGQIAAVNYTMGTDSGYSYGFFLEADDTRADGYSYEVAILTSTGSVSTYYVKNKITIDGVQVDGSNIINTGVVPNYTPIRYKSKAASGATELTAVDLPGSGTRTDDDYLKMDYANGEGAFTVTSKGSTLKRGTTTVKVDDKTTILYVPDDRSDTSAYSKLRRNDVFKANATFTIDVLDMDDTFANLVVVYGANDPTLVFDDSASIMLVTGKENLSGGGVMFTGYINFASEPDDIKALDGEDYKAIAGAASSANQAAEGDIIRYITNDSGEIISLTIWYDASAPTQEGVAANITQAKNTYNRYFATEGGGTVKHFSYGTILSKGRSDENIVLGYFVDTDTASDKFEELDGQTQFAKISGTTIYGKSYGEYVTLDIDSVKATDSNTSTIGSKAIVVWTDSTNPVAKMIYILD